MPGEQSVHSDEASNFRKILEKPSPNSTYSLRSEILSGTDSHKGYRTKTHRTSSHKRHRSRPHKERELDVTPDATILQARQLTRLLAHDEIEAVGLRRALSQASERLDQENRRAADAETRAREAEARVLALQAARHAAQVDAQREQETLKAYQAQLEVARSEILRAQKELDTMAAEKERAEEEAARERSKARAIAKEVEIQRARELGREEGKNQGYAEGRKDGWHLGNQQGIKAAYKEMMYYDGASIDSGGSVTPPLPGSGQPPLVTPSFPSPETRSAVLPAPSRPMPTSDKVSATNLRATSIRTGTPQASHKRSGSLTMSIKSRRRVNSDPKPPSLNGLSGSASAHLDNTLERIENATRPTSRISRSPSRERMSPVSVHNLPSTPRHTPSSPLPEGYIPLQENDRVSLPPPHMLDPPPSPRAPTIPPLSPHTPSMPLPPALMNDLTHGLQPPSPRGNAAPTITVQEPTPPEPLMTMPVPHPAPALPSVVTESNVKPSKVLARDSAARGASPPLPPLPVSGMERPNKGKQRQRMGPPRAGTGLHAPGRSSPSDTSTEFSQFEIVEQPERVRVVGMGRGNASQLSIIMEGGSTAAESPEPERFPTPQIRNAPATRDLPSRGHSPTPTQGIFNDPREYAEFSSPPLSPTGLAHRRIVAEQLRYSPSDDNRNPARSQRDDVSIKSTTTRASVPRRRPNPKMPERLGPSREVEVLEKHAEMYDAFGTGQFPSFDSQSSPEEPAVSTHASEFNRGHRRPMSTSTTVPEITIQPPSRPSSKGSKVSLASNRASLEQRTVATPSRRHSMQGSPLSPSRVPLPSTSGHMPVGLGTSHPSDIDLPPGFVPLPTQGPPLTPSKIPLPHTSGQIPINLNTPSLNDLGLPPGFIPLGVEGPPDGINSFSAEIHPKTPGTRAPGLPLKTPHLRTNALSGPSGLPSRTPSGVPLPLSAATTTWKLPDATSVQTSYRDLPRAPAMYEAAPPSPNFRYPMTPARMPLPESINGSPHGSAMQTPWEGWGGNALAADPTPGPSMPASLGRPMSLYSGDGGAKKKVSSTSLASSYKEFDPSTYVDPAFLACSSATVPPEPITEVHITHSRTASLRSTKTIKSKTKSIYAASVETATDEDDLPKSKS